MSNRVDPLYLKVATPRVTDSGRNALPSAKDLFKGLSVSSQFKISLHLNRNVTGANNLDGHLTRSGIFDDYSSSSMSYDFFASEAILPGVNFDMTEQPGSYQGMLEYMPTRRVWPDFEVTFYVDDQYNILRLFEEWVNYINPLYNGDGQYSGGSNAQDGMVDTNSYYKLRYPGKYKRKITITKFERDFFSNPNSSEGQPNQSLLSYQLIDAFPKQITAIPVSYDGSTLSRVTVIFGYTRYITVKDNGGKTSTYAGTNNTATNSKIYMPTQAIVTQSKAQRALTEGAPQRKNNFPWFNNNDVREGGETIIGNDLPNINPEPELDRITGNPGPRTPPKLDRITGNPGPRTPPKLPRSDFNSSLNNDLQRNPPKLNRITGNPGTRTPPKLDRITGNPGPRTPPKLPR